MQVTENNFRKQGGSNRPLGHPKEANDRCFSPQPSSRKPKGVSFSRHILCCSLSANRFHLRGLGDGHFTPGMLTFKRSAHVELKCLSLTSKFLGEGTRLTYLNPTLVQSPVTISQFFQPPQQSCLPFIFASGFLWSPFPIQQMTLLSFFLKYLRSFYSTDSALPCFSLLLGKCSLQTISKEFCQEKVVLNNPAYFFFLGISSSSSL